MKLFNFCVVADLNKPVRIDVFEKYIYWTTRDKGIIYKQDKFGREPKAEVTQKLGVTSDIKIYQKQRYNSSIPNPCEKNPCSHLCLITPNGYVCACPDGGRWIIGDSLRQRCDATFVRQKSDPIHCKCQAGGRCAEDPPGNVSVFIAK